MTHQQIDAACESCFQAGGSRAQVRNADGSLVYDAAESRAAAMRYAVPGQVVWYRGKVRCERRYEWAPRVAA